MTKARFRRPFHEGGVCHIRIGPAPFRPREGAEESGDRVPAEGHQPAVTPRVPPRCPPAAGDDPGMMPTSGSVFHEDVETYLNKID